MRVLLLLNEILEWDGAISIIGWRTWFRASIGIEARLSTLG